MAQKHRRAARARARAQQASIVEDVVALAAGGGGGPDDPTEGPPLGQLTTDARISRTNRGAEQGELRFSELMDYIRQAERGVVRRYADLTRRMLKSDLDLVSVVDTRIDGVVSVPWKVDPPETVAPGREADARRAADMCAAMLRAVPGLEQLFRDLLDAIGMGYAVAEIIWGRRDGLWVPIKIVAIHPRRFGFTDLFELVLREEPGDKYLDGERVQTRDGVGIRLPQGKYICHQPRQIADYPTSSGLFIPIARFWWVRQMVLRYWLGGAESQANRKWHGTYPQQGAKEAKQELFDALRQLSSDGVAATSEAVKILELGGDYQSSSQVWETLEARMVAAYAKGFLGSTLNVEVGETGGNRALGESQAEQTIEPRRQRDARALGGTIARDLFEPFLRYNSFPIGSAFDRTPPTPVWSAVFHDDSENGDEAAFNALVRTGKVRVDEVRTKAGVPPLGGVEGQAFMPAELVAEPLAPYAMPSASDAPPAVEGQATPDVQQSALNGAQVTSLLEIVTKVVERQLPRQSAIEIIISAFPIDRVQADRILGAVGRGFQPEPAAVEGGSPPLAQALSRAFSQTATRT
jgi:phage gp29-like protein